MGLQVLYSRRSVAHSAAEACHPSQAPASSPSLLLPLTLQEEWPLLIIVPASLRLVWAEELEKWLPHLRPASIHVIEGKENRVSQVTGWLAGLVSAEADGACVWMGVATWWVGLAAVCMDGSVSCLHSRTAAAAVAFTHPALPLLPRAHPTLQGSLPLVTITSYEMMQRLTCDACKGRGGPHTSVCAGQRLPCKDPQNCIASQRWRVVIVDGEGLLRDGGGVCSLFVSPALHARTPVLPSECAAPMPSAHDVDSPPLHFCLSLDAESHTLRTSNKAPDALHTEAVVCCLKLARRAILLTGTPSLSRPFDLFRQVDAVMPGLLGANRIAFAASYCNRREVPLPGEWVGGSAPAPLAAAWVEGSVASYWPARAVKIAAATFAMP
jgi:hypothetical protein